MKDYFDKNSIRPSILNACSISSVNIEFYIICIHIHKNLDKRLKPVTFILQFLLYLIFQRFKTRFFIINRPFLGTQLLEIWRFHLLKKPSRNLFFVPNTKKHLCVVVGSLLEFISIRILPFFVQSDNKIVFYTSFYYVLFYFLWGFWKNLSVH